MNKRALSERDICTKFITPALVRAGWDVQTQIREELGFTKGRVIVSGRIHRRGEAKRADYVLSYKANLSLAVIEAKDNKHAIGAGMQQALGYSESLDVPFVFSSNGDGFLFHDRTVKNGPVEVELTLDHFPSPDELWQRYCKWKGLDSSEAAIATQDYYPSQVNKSPRYYQLTAINRTIEAVAKGKNRLLLVMATGTGKTYVAFQIIWRLWKTGHKKRILFLADRNILIDQARTNDFKPFGAALTKISNRNVDKSYEIYLSLYQAVAGNEEAKNIYKQFSADFFDLIVVDECHRGSAAEDSAWREILEYFSNATQIGLTATPKETKDVSNIDYFGDPIFTYSLKQGIEDGFLAPFKVIRLDIDKDVLGWRPDKDQRDKHGQLIEDRIYNQRDMDRNLVLDKRTQLVAQRITRFLQATDPMAKTIVFCEDIDHAERMRQALVNENAEHVAKNAKYIMRITGDSPEGKAELDNFILPEERYPVVVTTSKLLNTGVDAQTCKLIVLDQRIESMTTFKQIIGRGTRINEDYNKFWFTIMDFKKATELFADPGFDGPPIQIYEPGPEDPVEPPEDGPVIADPPTTESPDGRSKYVVDKVEVMVLRERVQYFDENGKPITESLKDYTRKAVRKNFATLNAFLDFWSSAQQKKVIVEEMARHGVFFDALAEEVGIAYDPFDLVCHVAFDQPPLTRKERAANVRKRNYFSKYGEQTRQVLDALLDKYADVGLDSVESIDVLKVQPLNRLGTPVEIVRVFGGREKYLQAVRELEKELYQPGK
jgi:type I restriction enzyme R subunit